MMILVYNFAMRTRIFVLLVGLFSGGASLFAQTASEPFKFGTFELAGEQFVGIVLRDAYVVHLEKANLDFERSPLVVKLPMAQDMKELAGRYAVTRTWRRLSSKRPIWHCPPGSRGGDFKIDWRWSANWNPSVASWRRRQMSRVSTATVNRPFRF